MTREYTITIIEEDSKLRMTRKNEGFRIHELIGFVEEIKSDLLIQLSSMNKSKPTVVREFYDKMIKGKVVVTAESKEEEGDK